MIRLRSLRVLSFFAILSSAPLVALAQGVPITGTASVRASALPATPAVGGTVALNITVDLAGVTGNGPGGTAPAVLGAFQIAIGFDTTKLRFESAAGGTSQGFTGQPTASSGANTSGTVSIANSQINSFAPTGTVSVAQLTFTALNSGTTNFTVTSQSLSSALQPPSFGPTSIPGSGAPLSLTIYALPSIPTGLSPADNATGVNPPVTLTWTSNPNATRYDVFFGSTNPPALVTSTGTNSYPATVTTGTTYYWRVVAVNPAGNATTTIFRFTTSGPTPCFTPPQTVVNAPSEATSAIAYRVAWDPSANATEYRVEEATDSSFSNATITTVPAPAAETQFTHVVTANTTYFYRVAARNISGSCNVTSAFSPAVAVIVKTPPPPPTFLRVIAAAASTAGNFGSFFRTSAQLYNPGTSNLKGKLIYHSAGVSGSDNDPSLSYDIPPSATLYFADIVSSMKQSGLGSIDIISNSSFPVAIFRVFNDGGATGTTGMVEEMLRPEEALTEGESAVLIGPPDPVAARLNIGVRTLASGATLSVTQKTKDGATVKTLTKSYTGTYFNQTTDALFLEQTQGLAASDILIIKVTSGSAFIYGATTDNKTQDPSLQVGRKMN